MLLVLCIVPVASASDLDVNTDSSFTGNFGMEVRLTSPTEAYVQDDSPTAEPRYRARFYVDPSTLGYCHSNCSMRIFTGYDGNSNEAFALVYRINSGGTLQLRVEYYDGGSTQTKTYSINEKGWTALEIDWAAASSSASNDGSFDIWVNGSARSGVAGIDTDNLAVEYVRLGNPDGHSFYSGSMKFDDFESRRDAYIGLITDQPLGGAFPLKPDASPDTNPPRFEWTPVPGATQYRVFVYDKDLLTSVYDEFTTATFFRPPNALNENHAWRWRVRTYSDAGAGAYSDWFSFDFHTEAPGKPNNLQPRGTLTANPPTLTWNEVTGADKYLVYVYDIDVGTNIYSTQVTGPEFTPPTALDPSHAYWFRVLAHNNAGWGPTSKSRFFDYATAAPSKPVLIGPTGVQGGNPPTFTWEAQPGVLKYRLWVRNLTDDEWGPTGFRRTIFYTNSYTPPPMATGKNYRWKIKAYNNQGWSDNSDWMYFEYP
ncbi:MAG: fibronectin type III domain-containing protein [Acidobacteriota bacterium]